MLDKLADWIVPGWVRWLGLALALVTVFGAGFTLERVIKDKAIADLKLEHAELLAEAAQKATLFEQRARAAEQKGAEDLAEAQAQFMEDRQHENAVTQRRIADLAAGNERLRVALDTATRDPGVPDAPPTAGGGDGQATATLSRGASARLAGRYADYDQLVDQLTLCQGTVITYRKIANGQP